MTATFATRLAQFPTNYYHRFTRFCFVNTATISCSNIRIDMYVQYVHLYLIYCNIYNVCFVNIVSLEYLLYYFLSYCVCDYICVIGSCLNFMTFTKYLHKVYVRILRIICSFPSYHYNRRC